MKLRMKLCSTIQGVLTLGVLGTTLTGCGVNTFQAPTPAALTSLSGTAHGGANPVIGGVVKLYATSSGGYGAAGTLLGTTTTNQNGLFSFTSPATCPAGQQAYITASGGNPGAGTNPSYLFMAALGPCSSISSSTSVYVSEVTTVAAAYALRPFMTIAAGVVQVGAPVNNNAAAGTCTVSAGNVTTGCTGAGLAHAFANALNLANSVSVAGAYPNGNAYQVTPSNSGGVIPTALLNSLANSVEACVNSTGVTSGAGDGTPCGNLFSYTTPPVSGAAAPTNTLQAMLNVAQYPALTAANVTNLYNLASPISYYSPALTAAPADFSLAIAYPGPTVSGVISAITPTVNNASGFGSGTAYVTVPNVTLSGGSPNTSATATAVLGLTYFNVTGGVCLGQAGTTATFVPAGGGGSGAIASATYNSSGVATSGAVVAAGSGYTTVPTFSIPCTTTVGGSTAGTQPTAAQKIKGLGVVSITVNNQGQGYQSAPTVTIDSPAGTGSGVAPAVQAAATATVAAQSTPAAYALTLDANDDVYAGWQNAVGSSGFYSFETGLSANGTPLFTSANNTTQTSPRGSATDTLGHIWVASNNTTAIEELSTASGATVTTLTTGTAPFGLAVDKSNNVWYGIATTTAENLFELVQANTYTAATFATPPVFTNPVRAIAFDPNQNVYVSGFNATTNTAGLLPNSGTAAAPVYGTATSPIITATLTGGSGAGLALDASSNAWVPTTTGLFEVTPNAATPTTAFTPTGPLADNSATPNYDAVDGTGSIWVANNSSTTAPLQTINQYVPGTSTANAYSPCYAAAGATTCTAALNQPQRTQVDSTGSVWITSLNNGRVYQLLGTGAPTWPQLSLGTPGVEPQ